MRKKEAQEARVGIPTCSRSNSWLFRAPATPFSCPRLASRPLWPVNIKTLICPRRAALRAVGIDLHNKRAAATTKGKSRGNPGWLESCAVLPAEPQSQEKVAGRRTVLPPHCVVARPRACTHTHPSSPFPTTPAPFITAAGRWNCGNWLAKLPNYPPLSTGLRVPGCT